MQDCAPSHTSRVTQDFLKENVPNFINKNEWPPQSADLNPMDYSIWQLLKQKVYYGRKEKFTEAELRNKLLSSWEEIDEQSIKKSIGRWKKRLNLVVSEEGGPIDHKLNKC